LTTLDKDRLDELIKALQSAQQMGFSSLSSPVDALLETGIDLFLILSSLFTEGAQERIKNPEIKFSRTQVDSLNNPKQIRLRKTQKEFWDPQLSKMFRKLASFLVLVKNRKPDALPFMRSVFRTAHSPPRLSRENKETKETQHAISNKQQAYHRRQRKRHGHSKHQ